MITSSSVSNLFPRGPVVSGLLAFALLCPVGLHAQVSFVRGDANVDASVDLSDGVLILQYLFQGGRQLDCLDSGDADDSGELDLSDAVYDFNYLFLGGRPPPAPFPACGEDSTADGLGCESYELCDDKPPPAGGGRNIMVIISDDLGADSAACYGDAGAFASTPNIESLCQRGVVFRNTWANPLCSPTRASMLTGRYGFRTGVGHLANNNGGGLPNSEFTIPEALDANGDLGYSHACIGKWHLSDRTNGGMNHPNLAGFSHFSGGLRGGVQDYNSWPKVVNGQQRNATNYATTENVDDAIGWIEGQEGPWFLWLAFNAPHTPLHLPPAGLHSHNDLTGTAADISNRPRDYFGAMIEAMDSEIGRLWAAMGPEMMANTDVIYLGDNGTGRTNAPAGVSTRSGKGSLYEGGIHVPLVIAGPSVVDGGREVEGLVDLTDIYATVVELAGGDLENTVPAGVEVDSVSLLPYLVDPQAEDLRPWAFTQLFSEGGRQGNRNTQGHTIRDDRYKLIRFLNDTEEFYDLQADPLEQNNLAMGALVGEELARYENLAAIMTDLLSSEE
jgi:arylsulfatase A-like enzyme